MDGLIRFSPALSIINQAAREEQPGPLLEHIRRSTFHAFLAHSRIPYLRSKYDASTPFSKDFRVF